MNAVRVAFLVIAIGTPLCGFIEWLMLQLTFSGPLGLDDWHYLALSMLCYPILMSLVFAAMRVDERPQRESK